MQYLFPLISTIIIELLVIWFLGFRDKKLFLYGALASVITNPLLNYLISIIYVPFLMLIILETVVIIVEALFLKLCLRNMQIPFFKLSFVMNAASFLVGLWLPWNLIERLY